MPKTLPQKFFIKMNYQIMVMNDPGNFTADLLVPLPEGVAITTELTQGPFDLQIYFTKTRADVTSVLPDAINSLTPKSYLWLCYPKGGVKSKIPTDLNRDSFWEIASSHGLKPVHQISIDETWSGLRFRLDD